MNSNTALVLRGQRRRPETRRVVKFDPSPYSREIAADRAARTKPMQHASEEQTNGEERHRE